MADVACSGVSVDLLLRLNEARRRTDSLFEIVRPDSLYERPIAERHRIVFYIGHLEAFDRNLLDGRVLSAKSFHPAFDRLFAFGIDPVDGGLPSDQPRDWPSLDEVHAYTYRVRASLDEALGRVSFSEETFELLNVAIEHRLMHAETLAYMLHQLPFDRKVPPPGRRAPRPGAPIPSSTIEIPEDTVTLGLQRGAAFGWDNEFEANTVTVPAFAVDKYPVTNRDFLQFIAAGGYQDSSLWKAEDWAWITENNIAAPAFWKRGEQGWLYLTMFDEIPLPLDWPVYVSHAEAAAYARWAGKALPTEAQWQRAAADASRIGNFDFREWDPVPVNAYDNGRHVSSAWGNGWEWTSSIFEPFPGFQPFSFYPGYSANFFDGKHYIMKGGSPRTASCMLRPSFRNWFQPHYPYVYAGFRCVSAKQ